MKTVSVTSVQSIKVINKDSTLYSIDFDDNTNALMLAEEGEPYTFLNKLVDVEFRDDFFEGEVRSFVATIVDKKVVNVINRKEHIKLFSSSFDPSSNVIFKDINIGDEVHGAVMYCTKVTYDSSLKTDWIDLTVSDKTRRVSHVRIFTPDRQGINFAGSYIKCNIRKNKYGLSTQDVVCCEGEFPPNPEVDLAENYVLQYIENDKELKKVFEETNLLPFMKEYAGFEKGSLLMTLAMEIDFAVELTNVSPAVDSDAIVKALIADKFWVLQPNSHYSREFLCLYRALRYKDVFTPLVQDIIGGNVPDIPDERIIYTRIKELVRDLIYIRKGEVEID